MLEVLLFKLEVIIGDVLSLRSSSGDVLSLRSSSGMF